jgi:hypothetical protein
MQRQCNMRKLCFCLFLGAVGLTQSPEGGRIERHGSQATLIVDSGRPLDSAAITIAEQFGIPVSAEDPPYVFHDDMKDVTAEVARSTNPLRRVFVPKGGRLEVQFTLSPDGSPVDVRVLLRELVGKANVQFPFGYRLEDDGDSLTLVPARTRDMLGRVVGITPLLDRRVTIEPGVRTIAETAKLMADALSAQTGLRVSCCQGFVAGVPWGMREVAFEARDEPARSVLKRLIAASLEGRPNGYYWLQRCDPLRSQWCVINLQYVTPRTETPEEQSNLPRPASRTRNSDGSRWFGSSSSKGSGKE